MILRVQLGLLVLIAALVGHGYAHSWYPSRCCAGNDCAPLEGLDAVQRRMDGWFIPATGETIPFDRTEPSEDLRFHRCVRADGSTRCLFSPPTGS